MFKFLPPIVSDFLNSKFGSILFIVVAAYVLLIVGTMLLEKVIRATKIKGKFKTRQDEKLRQETLVATLRRTLRVFIMIIAIFMILAVLGLDIAPLLAGAGVAGVALGFGAQTMVKDYLAGFFIIAENQYRVGDVLMINQEVSGTVEHITLRVTVLRDIEGMLHHIPNGQIRMATNMTMDYAQIDLNIAVSYESDIDHVEKVINEVGQKLAAEEAWLDLISEAPYMVRVNEFTDAGVIIKIHCRTQPMHQWAVKGELLRRLKKAFDTEGISIALPQRVIHQSKV